MENLIESLVTGKLESFRSQIHNSLYEKVAQALEAKKIEVAQKMYCTECSENLEEGKMPPQLAAALAKKKGGKKGEEKDKKTPAKKGKKPDFLDLDKDGNKKESMKKAAKDAKKGKK